MTLRVVVHIGSTKTGSSALQAMLYESRDALLEKGVLYSERGVAANAHHLLAGSIHPGAWRMHLEVLPEDRDAYFRETTERIIADAREHGAHTIIISSEYFWWSFDAELYKRFRAAFPDAQFELIAFVRRQDEWILSSYMQGIKNGDTRDFPDWLKWIGRWPTGLHYYRVINRWAYFLDAKKVHVLRYSQAKSDVLGAFGRALDIDIDPVDTARIVNPSPSVDSLASLLEINRSDLDERDKHQARKRILRTLKHENGARPQLSAAERDEVIKLAERSDRLLGAHYLDGQPLLADLAVADGGAAASGPGKTG